MTCNPMKPKPTRRKIFLWKKANIHKIQVDIKEFGEKFTGQAFDNNESMWAHFKTALKKIQNQRVPTKMTSAKHTHPWMNTQIRRKINQ